MNLEELLKAYSKKAKINKNILKDEIVKSNLPDNVKKQLISSLNKNNIKEVVIVFLKLLNIGSNIIGLFDNED